MSNVPVWLQQVEAGEHCLGQRAAPVPCDLGCKQPVRDSNHICCRQLCCGWNVRQLPVSTTHNVSAVELKESGHRLHGNTASTEN